MDSDPSRWPWPTFTVNIVGAILLGYFTIRLLERQPSSSYRRPFLGTGLCGGLDHLFHHAGRDGADARTRALPAGVELHRGEHRGRVWLRSDVAISAAAARSGTPMSTVVVWCGVGVLGGIGAILRFLVDGAVSRRAARAFPFGTLTVNLSGSLALGLIAGLTLSANAARLRVPHWSGRTRRSLPGCWKPNGSPRSGRCSPRCQHRGERGVRPRRCGARTVARRPVVNEDCLKLTTYFGERQRSGADSSPRRCSTCSANTNRLQHLAARYRRLRAAPPSAH